MSIPLFPSLRPNILSPFWCELDPPIDEEAEILELEQEQREWKASLGQVFTNVVPIGKTSHDVDEDDLDDMGDDEDDTTSSDGDDMDDDDDGDTPDLYDIHNLPAPAPVPSAAAASTASTLISSTPSSAAANTDSSSSSEPSFTVTLNRSALQAAAESVDAREPSARPPPRPPRMIVGRLIPAARPGMPQEAVRAAYIDTTGRPVYSGRTSTGSVSPTSRAYIEAALHSPTGPVHLDIPDDDDDTDDDVPDRAAPPRLASRGGQSRPLQSPRSFPGPVSDHLSRYQQMVAVGQIHPSVSSTQIDNLIETMHQAQRAHAARAAAPTEERVTALTEASSSNVRNSIPSNLETDSDSSIPSNEGL